MNAKNDILEVFETRSSNEPIRSISDLASWMNAEHANKIGYGIGWDIFEGLKIKEMLGAWHWQYTERGQARTLETFQSEVEIASHAYEQIRHDPWAWTHCVGWFKTINDKKTFTSSLEDRQIPFYCAQIPYGGADDPRHRVFVFGRDVLEFTESDPSRRS